MPLSRQRPKLVGLVVFEGVLVHSEAQAWCVAVRRPTGEVVVRRRMGLPRLPWLLRLWGIRELAQSLRELTRLLGALHFSAQQAGLANGLARAAKGSGELPPLDAAEQRRQRLRILSMLVLLVAFGVAGLALILLGPPVVSGAASTQPLWGRQVPLLVAESLLGALLVPVYLGAMARIGPLRRFCDYHGALHLGLAAYEAGRGLDLRSARRCDFGQGCCSVVIYASAALILPTIARLFGVIVPQLGGLLLVADHAPKALFAALVVRAIVLLCAVAVAKEVVSRLWQRRTMRALGRQMLLATAHEPSDETVEVVLAAIRAVASSNHAQSESPSPKLAWPPLAADACTRSSTRFGRTASR